MGNSGGRPVKFERGDANMVTLTAVGGSSVAGVDVHRLCGMSFAVLAVLLAVVLPSSYAQTRDIVGTWQGTINSGSGQRRSVIKIFNGAHGLLEGVFYSIDEASGPWTIASITVHGSAVKMSIPAMGATYEGDISADGRSISGALNKGDTATLLRLARATSETTWTIPEVGSLPNPMTDSSPSFKDATIKLSDDGSGKAFLVRDRQFLAIDTTLNELIGFAYGLQRKQIENGSDWTSKEQFDLVAEANGQGQPDDAQWRTMLQKLLADRFSLRFHQGKEVLSVYAIVDAKGAIKLANSQGNPNGLPRLFFRGLGYLDASNATMQDFAQVLERRVLDKPVIDETGLPGRWDFVLQWTPDATQFAVDGLKPPPPGDHTGQPAYIFDAVKQQLGLKLQTIKAPVEVLIIDDAKEPRAN
jgi:uncharacterized protein (TIGR03435 family)